jgi:hypothetical protein
MPEGRSLLAGVACVVCEHRKRAVGCGRRVITGAIEGRRNQAEVGALVRWAGQEDAEYMQCRHSISACPTLFSEFP